VCAWAYERVGLLWAARSTYLNAASIAVNELWQHGEVTLGFGFAVHRLKWVELSLGRLPHLMQFHEMDAMLRRHFQQKGDDAYHSDTEDAQFDVLLARTILRTPFQLLTSLAKLPDALDSVGLFTAASALLFILGSPERMQELADEGGETAVKVADRIWGVAADIPLPDRLRLYAAEPETVSSSILGCTIDLECPLAPPCVEVAEWTLAVLESLLSTSAIDRAFATEPQLTAALSVEAAAEGRSLSVEHGERTGHPHLAVACAAFAPYELTDIEHQELGNAVLGLAIDIMSRSTMFRDPDADLTALFRDEKVTDRAVTFTSPIAAVRNVLGRSPGLRLASVLPGESPQQPSKTPTGWVPPEPGKGDAAPPPRPGTGEPPPTFTADSVSHREMRVVSHIRGGLWDRAGWSGTLFLGSTPPMLALIFTDRGAAEKIFTYWREELGTVDKGGELEVTIVRGINAKSPHDYRVLVGPSTRNVASAGKLFMIMKRINTMQSSRPDHVDAFISMFAQHGRFRLAPAFMTPHGPEPSFAHQIELTELNVRQAWQIGRHDFDTMGVLADDDVIVPADEADPPVRALLEWKREKARQRGEK
jgi:hypothetical protein